MAHSFIWKCDCKLFVTACRFRVGLTIFDRQKSDCLLLLWSKEKQGAGSIFRDASGEAGHGQVMYGLIAFQSTGNGEMYGESGSF